MPHRHTLKYYSPSMQCAASDGTHDTDTDRRPVSGLPLSTQSDPSSCARRRSQILLQPCECRCVCMLLPSRFPARPSCPAAFCRSSAPPAGATRESGVGTRDSVGRDLRAGDIVQSTANGKWRNSDQRGVSRSRDHEFESGLTSRPPSRRCWLRACQVPSAEWPSDRASSSWLQTSDVRHPEHEPCSSSECRSVGSISSEL